jgi:ATP-grasp domain-containing protein
VYFLYPSDPLRTKRPDEFYADELGAVRAAGFGASVFSLEEFQAGSFSASPPLPAAAIVYRGWMLSADEYAALAIAIKQAGAQLFTDLFAYLSTHHLPNWYPAIRELTPETHIFPVTADLEHELCGLNWSEYFIKDYVKSLKTSIGSRISTPEQAATVAAEMLHFRGTVEGGFCVRRVEDFLPETEQRYFVLDSVPHAAGGDIPPIVSECAQRIRSRFFSVDVVRRSDGVLRVVEVGDGQVSDLVGWTLERFVSMLRRNEFREGMGLAAS